MKKFSIRMVTFLLICTAVMFSALPASAAEFSESSRSAQVIVFSAAQAAGLPFTMKPGTNITDLWTTNRTSGGYYFIPGQVNNGTVITTQGSFNHSSSTGECKAGVCHPVNGVNQADSYTTRRRGYPFGGSNGLPAALIKLSELDRDTTYYGFIKNNSGSGYVYDANITIGVQ